MKALFVVNCSEKLAIALGARPMARVRRPNLSFPVYDEPATHHAEMNTEAGPLAWYWLLDGAHRTIQQTPGA